MVGDVITVETNATIRKAVRLVNNREIGCLVVVKEGKPAGIVTERDILKRVLVAGRDPRAMEVGEIMSKTLISMKPEKRIEEAVKPMFRHAYRSPWFSRND
jgi:CBS domain-containing protein